MKIYRQLGILTALLGAGCNETGAMGLPGEMGIVGEPGLPGAAGPAGVQGDPGPDTLSLTAGTCPLVYAPTFDCTVTCPGVGAIAVAHGEVVAGQPQFGTVTFESSGQSPTDPSTWRFTFATSGLEGTSTMNMSVVCFTPPE